MVRATLDVLEDLMPEGIPATGVYQSFNGKIMLGGYELIRVSNAVVRVTSGVAKYQEVGNRYGIPYRQETRISLSITRGYVNFYEMLLALGFKPNALFRPGEVYSSDLSKDRTLLSLLESIEAGDMVGMDSDMVDRPANRYPVKTNASFVVNKDHLQPLDSQAPAIDYTDTAFEHILDVTGVMINMSQLSIGAGGDIITSGPIDALGEAATWRLQKIESVEAGE